MPWKDVRIGSLVKDGALAINDGYRMRNVELGASGIPFVRGGDIRDGWIDTDTEDHIRPELRDRVRAKFAQPGDVAFITKGTVGRVGWLREGQPRVVFAPQVAYWRVLNSDILDHRFLFYLLKDARFQAELDAVKTHGAMAADYVSIRQQHDFRLPIPPIKDQRAIAHILGTLDDKIELNRRTNQTLEEIARTLFKSWFVDFDPVRAKAEGRSPEGMDAETAALFPDAFEESELGPIPEGWTIEPLDALAAFRNGLALQRYRPESNAVEKLPVVKIAHLRAGQASTSEWASALIDPECILDDGDVVFSWSGSLLVVLWCGGQAALNQHLFKLTSAEYPKWFYYHWLLEHLPWFQRIASGKATTMGHIQRHHLNEARCVVPPLDLVQRLDVIFEPLLDARIAAELEARTLARVRDTLLPKLLSGDLRIDDPDRFLEENVP